MKILRIFLLVLIIILNIYSPALAQRAVTLKVDGKVVKTDVAPVIENGRTLIPVRAVFEDLGAKVEWNNTARSVKINYSDTVITLYVDKTSVKVNQKNKELDVPAKIINGRTMIPVRFVATELGMTVDWVDSTSTVVISTQKGATANKAYKLGEVKVQDRGGYTTITIKGVGGINPSIMKLQAPLRIVFDFENSTLAGNAATYKSTNPDIKSVRTGQYEKNISRVVVDLEKNLTYKVSASGNEYVITFENKSGNTSNNEAENKPENKPTATKGYVSSVVLSKEAKEKLVCIDPGHGGSEVGTVGKWNGKEIYEKDINIKISKLVNEMLINNGAKTYMLRQSDEAIAVSRRSKMANEKGAHFYMSIHNNAAENTSKRGVQICYSDANARFSAITNNQIANIFYENIASLGLRKAGLLNNPRYIVIYKANMPAIIVENAFVSNKDDLALLMDDKFLEKLAQKICDSVLEVLNLSAKSTIIKP